MTTTPTPYEVAVTSYWESFYKAASLVDAFVCEKVAKVLRVERVTAVSVEAYSSSDESAFSLLAYSTEPTPPDTSPREQVFIEVNEDDWTEEQCDEWDVLRWEDDHFQFARELAQDRSNKRGYYTFRERA